MWKIKNRIRFGRGVSIVGRARRLRAVLTLCVIAANRSSVLGAGGDGWVFNFIGRDGRPWAAEFKIVESKANGAGGTIDCIVPR